MIDLHNPTPAKGNPRRAYRASRKAWQAERREARQLKSATLCAFLFGGDA